MALTLVESLNQKSLCPRVQVTLGLLDEDGARVARSEEDGRHHQELLNAAAHVIERNQVSLVWRAKADTRVTRR